MTSLNSDLFVLKAFTESVSLILGLPVSNCSCDVCNFEADDNLQLEIKDRMCTIRVKKEKVNVPEFVDVAFRLRIIWQKLNQKTCDDIVDRHLTGRQIDAVAFTDLVLKRAFRTGINWKGPQETMENILKREVVIANELQDKVTIK